MYGKLSANAFSYLQYLHLGRKKKIGEKEKNSSQELVVWAAYGKSIYVLNELITELK